MVSEQLVAEAISWVGVPYKKDGRSRAGVDCSNWFVCLLDALGLVRDVPVVPSRDGFWRKPGDFIGDWAEKVVRDHLVPGTRLETLNAVGFSYGLIERGMIVGIQQLPKLEKITHLVLVENVHSYGIDIIHASRLDGRVVRGPLDPSHPPLKGWLFRG